MPSRRQKHRSLTIQDVILLAKDRIIDAYGNPDRKASIRVYGVPRGGAHLAYLLFAHTLGRLGYTGAVQEGDAYTNYVVWQVVDDPDEADVIVDDIIDSGATRDTYRKFGYEQPFLALIDKTGADRGDKAWYTFPWEELQTGSSMDTSLEDAGRRILQVVGEDLSRDGLRDTPKRFAKAFRFWTQGYTQDPAHFIKKFERDQAHITNADNGGLVIVKDIPLYSLCEHHMAPFFGTASIGYVPGPYVLGLSKFSRLLDIFARRLQTQENLTDALADCLMEHLEARAVGVVTFCRHLCMESRGICRSNVETQYSALRGLMLEKETLRSEFLSLIKR